MTRKQDARAIFNAAISAVDPAVCVRKALQGRRLAPPVRVIGAGKAAVPMAQAVVELYPEAEGVLVTKYGHGGPTRRIRVFEAGHPVPDDAGIHATSEILKVNPNVCLLSGGASALLVAPAEGITLADKQTTTDLLLRAGAPIEELNCVRKHLSSVKGGRLARAGLLTLVLSDVIGDRLDVIASGPTVPDPTTCEDALRILDERGVYAPPAVLRRLERGPETPKVVPEVENVIVGNNELALDGAAVEAKRLGYKPTILTEIQGEARNVARDLLRQEGTCILAGGETTVTVRGPGTGGRCQELGLAAAIEIAGQPGVTVLAASTDGTDGPTDAAGAIVDGSSAKEDARAHLEANDSHTYLRRHGGLVVTGPTRTNVMDIVVILRESLTDSAGGVR